MNDGRAAPFLGKWVIYPHSCGLRFHLLVGDKVANVIVRTESDDVATRCVLSRLTAGGTFLDCGANQGWFTLRAAATYRALGSGTVHAFEPQAAIHAALSASVTENGLQGHVVVHQIALGNQRRSVAMSDGGKNSGSAHLVSEGATVQMLPLDDFEFGKVDLLKIDIEGAEPFLLSGARSIFRRQRPPLLVEINPRKLKEVSGVTARELVDAITDLGYRSHRLTRKGPRPLPEPVEEEFADLLFLPNKEWDAAPGV